MDKNVDREEIGRRSGMGTSGSSMQREGAGEKVKEGWLDLKAKVRQKWNQITDKDLDAVQRRDKNTFVKSIHDRVGGDRNLVEREVDTYARETNYRWD